MSVKSIDYNESLADSHIMSYHSEGGNVVVFLRCWNENVLRFTFIECAFFQVSNNWKIVDVCETNGNDYLFNNIMKNIYEIMPINNPYKMYQFVDDDDGFAVQIVCTGLDIKKIDKNGE